MTDERVPVIAQMAATIASGMVGDYNPSDETIVKLSTQLAVNIWEESEKAVRKYDRVDPQFLYLLLIAMFGACFWVEGAAGDIKVEMFAGGVMWAVSIIILVWWIRVKWRK